MNRLQKKCVLASAALHLSLLGLICVGPGFTSVKPAEPIREIDFTPTIVTAENIAGGGNPNAGRAAPAVMPKPAPPEPQAKPAPEPKETPKPEPERRPEPVRKPEPDPDDFSDKKPRLPKIVTVPTVRHRTTKSSEQAEARERERERKAAAQARAALARDFARAADSIREGSASATAIDDDFGPGGGGPAYAGYDSLVQKIYQDAWVKPTDTSSDAPVTYATVTIARDGSVVPGSARIIDRSGDSQMDSSVQRTLERVTSMGQPFPEGIKEKQRTYKLKFDLKKRRLT